MTYHAMFSLYIMTGLLALVISVSLFCKSIAEAKEWKKKFGERNWDYLYRVLIALVAIATSGYAIFWMAPLPRPEITVPDLQASGAYREERWNFLFR